MKIYHEIKAGIGDVICWNFSPTNYGEPNPRIRWLPRMIEARRRGAIEAAAVIMRAGNPRAKELFAPLGLRVLDAADVEDGKGWIPSSELPPPVDPQPDAEPIGLPLVRPDVAVPRQFILFSELASAADRCLTDPAIYRFIKDTTRLPIVKVGRHQPAMPHTATNQIPADLDLTNRTTLPQTAWLAKHAVAIVAPLSFYRCFSSLLNVPVIELVEDRAKPATLDRTVAEYAGHFYAMNDLNRWLKWPLQQEDLAELLVSHCRRAGINLPLPTDPIVREAPIAIAGNVREMPGIKPHWHLPATTPTTKLMREILSNAKSAADFIGDPILLEHCELDADRPLRILDFGAGMLRNTATLLKMSPHWAVTAYDTETMLRRGVDHFRLLSEVQSGHGGRLSLTSSWEQIKREKFDAVLASMVFQHIEAAALAEICRDLKSITNKLCVFGRWRLDEIPDVSVWPLVLEHWKPLKISRAGSLTPMTLAELLAGDPERHAVFIGEPRR